MIKPIVAFLFWIGTLGVFSVNIKWADGWSFKATGWPDALWRWIKGAKP